MTPDDLPEQEKDWNKEVIDAAFLGNVLKLVDALDEGAEPDFVDIHGYTPLMMAAEHGHIDILAMLLCLHPISDHYMKHKVEVDRVSTDGKTALSLAIEGGHYKAIKLLLEGGAYIERKNNRGRTPLIAAANTGNVETVGVLLAAGADLNAVDDDGHNAEFYASEWGNKEMDYVFREAIRGDRPNPKIYGMTISLPQNQVELPFEINSSVTVMELRSRGIKTGYPISST